MTRNCGPSPIPVEAARRRRRRAPPVGTILQGAPAWPREWAQRLGRRIQEAGGTLRTARLPGTSTWGLSWSIGRRSVLVLEVRSQGVLCRFRLPRAVLGLLTHDERLDPELREILTHSPVRGRYLRVTAPLDSSRRVRSLEEMLPLLTTPYE
jgi:hypothetical protein